MKQYKKVPIKGYNVLNMYPVYSESICNGREPFIIVGIRENESEIEGDFSGGTHNISQKDWVENDDLFVVRTVCEEQLKPNGCQIHNIYCCGGGDVVKNHINNYWENLTNGTD